MKFDLKALLGSFEKYKSDLQPFLVSLYKFPMTKPRRCYKHKFSNNSNNELFFFHCSDYAPPTNQPPDTYIRPITKLNHFCSKGKAAWLQDDDDGVKCTCSQYETCTRMNFWAEKLYDQTRSSNLSVMLLNSYGFTMSAYIMHIKSPTTSV